MVWVGALCGYQHDVSGYFEVGCLSRSLVKKRIRKGGGDRNGSRNMDP